MMWVWSFVLAAVGILGIYLAGRKNLWGWALGVFAQALWIVFAIVTQQWGFIFSALAYGWVYGLNWWKWSRDRRRVATERGVR
jgi:nicotinamide riboside transporter PnuC